VKKGVLVLASTTLVALMPVGSGQAAPGARLAKTCPDTHNAAEIHASGPLSCRLIRIGVGIYQGAPVGCVESYRCGQSGVGPGGAVMFASCRRSGLRVGCVISWRRDHTRLRGKVRFTMLRDPYGCPDNPVCP
jgi:hypothetical protein